jgi:hypothetical protein
MANHSKLSTATSGLTIEQNHDGADSLIVGFWGSDLSLTLFMYGPADTGHDENKRLFFGCLA